MGSYRKYLPEGGFSEYLYDEETDKISAGGITAKVIFKRNEDNYHSGLPTCSDKSEAYLKRSDEGNHEIETLRIYKNRQANVDFDWGHGHQGLEKGVVHVHILSNGEGGFHTSGQSARYMTQAEIEKYGPLIKKANPNARFLPSK